MTPREIGTEMSMAFEGFWQFGFESLEVQTLSEDELVVLGEPLLTTVGNSTAGIWTNCSTGNGSAARLLRWKAWCA